MKVETIQGKKSGPFRIRIISDYRDIHHRPRKKIIRSYGTTHGLEETQRRQGFAEIELQYLRDQNSLFPRPQDPLPQNLIQIRQSMARYGPASCQDLNQLEELQRISLGVEEVFSQIYKAMGYHRILGTHRKTSQVVLAQAVYHRLMIPGQSKRGHSLALAEQGSSEYTVEKFYRMMDFLDQDRIDAMKALTFHYITKELLQESVDGLFYDVTTLYFESETSDELRSKGWSKDGKHKKVQVVLGLLQNREGLPLGYTLFKGNTADVQTLETAMDDIRKKHPVFDRQRLRLCGSSSFAITIGEKHPKTLGMDGSKKDMDDFGEKEKI